MALFHRSDSGDEILSKSNLPAILVPRRLVSVGEQILRKRGFSPDIEVNVLSRNDRSLSPSENLISLVC